MRTIGDSAPSSQGQGQTCSYSRRKAEKQTRCKADDNDVANEHIDKENQQLVDRFVQDVIEKAKTEYFRQCEQGGDSKKDTKKGKHLKGKENGSIGTKSQKKPGKDRHKHRHHYKYSDPVDEKEISKYENPEEEDSLLEWNPNFGEISTDSRRSSDKNGSQNRFVLMFRRLMTCCFGKT